MENVIYIWQSSFRHFKFEIHLRSVEALSLIMKDARNWPCTINEQRHEISNNVVCATSKAYAQSDQSLCRSLEYTMNVKLLTKQHLEFLSLKGGLHKLKFCFIFFYSFSLKLAK